jgi:aryl-alcohol dehydrogenase-like predicted oxidoreductase
MEYTHVGHLGLVVSRLCLGTMNFGPHTPEADSHTIMDSAVAYGINFFDTANVFGRHLGAGATEEIIGRWFTKGDKRRDKVVLATKVYGTMGDWPNESRLSKLAIVQQCEESLRRLRTDRIDLVQHHEILRYEDPHRIFDEDGAHGALVDARKAGKIRYIGFTGHKDPRIHLYMLEVAQENGFRFDTVQMPLNVMDAHYRSFEKLVLPELLQQDIGVLGMKCMANGIILRSRTVTPAECLRYALHLPTSVVITGIDSMQILEQALDAARSFAPMTPSEVTALLARTAKAASKGHFELFKTTSAFDGTAQNPAWLGEEPEHVQQVMPS